jgi:4-amino-4-deoxy-L-arabinose transferase
MLAAYFLLYVAPLPFRPLFMPDETRYAEVPREMLATGDWIVPRLNGLRYFEKPVFGYWLTALSILCFGENRFAIRLPSALATGLSAMLLVFIFRRSGHASSALLGAAVFLTSLQVYTLGVFNLLDPVFSLFVTASLVCFYFAYQACGGRARLEWLAASGVACGLGFLTKGFLAFVIPVATIGPFLLWQKCRKELFTLPWIPLLVSVTVILPWAMMIHLREPDYWRHFIFVEHFNRFTAIDIHSFHPQPFWIFLPYLIGGAIPWTFAAPAAIRGVRKAGWRDPLIRYALCWLLFPFLLLSASKGKLGTYILPCFAPLSLLFAVGLAESMKKQDSRPFRVAAWTSATVAGLAATVIAAMSFLNFTSRPIFASDETWKWGAGSAALAAWCGISIASARAKRMAMGLGLFAVVPVALMLSAHFILPKWATWSRTPETFVARYAEAIGPEDQVYSTSNLAPAVGWVLKRNDIGILGRGGELEYGLNYPDARNRQIRGVPELLVQINDRTRTRVLILVIDDEQYSDNLEDLPGATRTDKADGFVFARYDRYLDTPKTR